MKTGFGTVGRMTRKANLPTLSPLIGAPWFTRRGLVAETIKELEAKLWERYHTQRERLFTLASEPSHRNYLLAKSSAKKLRMIEKQLQKILATPPENGWLF